MQRLCRLPGRCGRRRKLCGPLVSSLETGRPRLASRPRISGGRREKKKKEEGNLHHTTVFETHTHTHTRQTNHYIAHLQVDYQIGTTVHICLRYDHYVWFFSFSFTEPFHYFFPPRLFTSFILVWQKLLLFFVFFYYFFPSPLHVTLFLQQRTFKDRSL